MAHIQELEIAGAASRLDVAVEADEEARKQAQLERQVRHDDDDDDDDLSRCYGCTVPPPSLLLPLGCRSVGLSVMDECD
eukprot:COSAG01_NODE_36663_length_514_cov_0.877108_1_plen_79_part_00